MHGRWPENVKSGKPMGILSPGPSAKGCSSHKTRTCLAFSSFRRARLAPSALVSCLVSWPAWLVLGESKQETYSPAEMAAAGMSNSLD